MRFKPECRSFGPGRTRIVSPPSAHYVCLPAHLAKLVLSGKCRFTLQSEWSCPVPRQASPDFAVVQIVERLSDGVGIDVEIAVDRSVGDLAVVAMVERVEN